MGASGILTTSAVSRRRRARFLTATGLSLVAALAGAEAQNQQGERGPLVTALQIRGLRHFQREELTTGLATKSSRCRSPLYAPLCWISRSATVYERRYLEPLELRRDVLRIRLYLWRRGYRDALVSSKTERTADGVRVIFDIDERKPTILEKLIVEQTDTVLPKRVIDASIQIRAGEPLDLVAIDSTRGLLQDQLWERGYADAEVELDTTAVSDQLDSGPVTIRLHPGSKVQVRAISIEGNDRVSDRTIGRLLMLSPGSLFRRSDALGSQRNLWLSGLFSEVDLQSLTAGDSSRVIQVRVREANLQRLELGTGFTTVDFLQVDAQFTRFNLIGSARRLTVHGTVSNLLANQLNGAGIMYDVTNGASGAQRDAFLQPTWSANIDLVQPWFLSPRNQLGTSVFAYRRSVPGVVIDRGAGASVTFTHDFRIHSNTTLGYTFEKTATDASDVYFCVNFGVCEPATIDVVAASHRLAPISSVTQIDLSNDPFTPNRGYRARLDVEHASALTASDFHYNRAELDGAIYHRLSRTSVLAGRVRLGWLGPLPGTSAALGVATPSSGEIVHPRTRFYAGGSHSVRGYGENQLGPRVLTISSLVLTDTGRAGHCTPAQIADGTCDPNIAGIPASAFQARPLGGTSVAEGSVELRFPIGVFNGLSGAVFIDGAVVRGGQFSNVIGAVAAITPGFGVRFGTPVGPVRLDLGLRPRLVELLPVVTDVTDPDGTQRLVGLTTSRKYDPLDRSGGPFRAVLNRLMLHLAIGPAF